MKNWKMGTQPIAWSNDDFHDLGGSIPLEQCLEEMQKAGYVGTELGHKFPKEPSQLKSILGRYQLSLVSGWYSTYLLNRSLEEEKKSFLKHLHFLSEMGSPVIIVAECTRRIYDQSAEALGLRRFRPSLSPSEWARLGDGLNALGDLAAQKGIHLVYHHHMGTLVQNAAEIDHLMSNTSPKYVRLLADTGHMAFAGIDPISIFQKYSSRIGHIHLKNIRPEIVEQVCSKDYSFERAVRAGVFTVPGDGGLDFKPILNLAHEAGYEGWLVVEAEQDPSVADPYEYAKKAREYLKQITGF